MTKIDTAKATARPVFGQLYRQGMDLRASDTDAVVATLQDGKRVDGYPAFSEAEMAHIGDWMVKRVNSHEALVEALKKVRIYGADRMWPVAGGNQGSFVQSLYNEIDAALKLAEGE